MSQSCIHPSLQATSAAALCSNTKQPTGLLARLHSIVMVTRTRRALAKLEPHELADIGLSAAQAQREAKRSIWDAPQSWNS